jgi:toxin secretion/phage lysis holin
MNVTLLNGLIAVLAQLASGMDKGLGSAVGAFHALLVMMALDFISGWMVALREGRANSSTSRQGVVQKSGYFVAIMLAYLVDVVTNQDTPLAVVVVILFLFFTEAISVVEHLGRLGVPLPSWLVSRLAKLRDQYDSAMGNGSNSDSNQTGAGGK